MTKKACVVTICLLLVMSFSYSVRSAQAKDVAGKSFYTKANIWYENPEKIYSTNYHRGAVLPLGSRVIVQKISKKEIRFNDKNGLAYRIIYVKKHSPGVSVEEHFNRYFSEEDVLRKGGPFDKLSKKVRNNIEIGIIEEGMSKEAVIMSYGYPPPIKTHNLKSNLWTFMENRFVTRAVQFKDNKVAKAR